MKLIVLLKLFCWGYGYILINGIIPEQKEYYISSQLSKDHTKCIYHTINYYNSFDFLENLKISDTYSSDHIRISYYQNDDPNFRLTASTEFRGHLQQGNVWSIDWIDIKLNSRILYQDLCMWIILHEILHTRGIYHSQNTDSFMNKSVYLVNNIVQDTDIPYLELDDFEALLELELE